MTKSKIFCCLLFAICFLPFASLALDNPEQRLTETIKDYVVAKYPNWNKDEIKISFKSAEQTFAGLKALDNAAAFNVVEVYSDFKPVGNVVFPVAIKAGSEETRKIFVRARVEVLRKIVAASHLIKKNKLIEPSDLKLAERDVALLPNKYYVDASPLAGKEAKLSIPENSTLFEWMIGDIPPVRSGAEVLVTVNSPGIKVQTKGEALSDGYLNSEIKVKCVDSQKIVTGRVIAGNRVEVNQ